jgi:AraC-like DNA-binding protein
MNLQRYIPSPDLKPFLRDLLFIETEAATHNLLLPDTSLVLAIRYKGSITHTIDNVDQSLPLATFSGLRLSPRHIQYSAATANLLIRFEPGGAAAFFAEPLQEFFQESVSASELKGFANTPSIAAQLSDMTTNIQRAAFIQQYLRTKITTTPDPLIQQAVKTLQATKGTLPINNLAKQLYISQDAFEKRFRKTVGMTAKRFSSLIRLRHIIDTYTPERALTLTHLAHSAGYFDQAHFTHDFQRFTGQAPRQFFASAKYW